MKPKDIFYIILLIALFFYMNSNKRVLEVNTTTTDTIYKTIHTRQIDTLVIEKNPKPITIVKDFDISMYTDSIEMLNALIEATKIRTYKKVYEDSLYSAEVINKVKGELLESRFSMVLKPRKFQTIETHTKEKKYPKYSLYYGINARLDDVKPSLGGSFGFQNRKGTIYTIGYDTNLQWSAGVQIRLLTKY